jgi:type II secretory pathway component GspD/PulD (secretin)
MNKTVKKLMTCAILFLTAGFCFGAGQTDNQADDIGRDNPFGGGFGDIQQDTTPVILVPEQPLQTKPLLFVQTITLKFLNASNLKNALDKMSSEHGSISVDDNTNSLIICDTKENLERILVEVKKADKTPQQIVIEVVIIDVKLKDDTEIGVDWDLLTTDNKDASYRQSTIFPNRLSVVAPDVDTIGSATAYAPVGLGGELAIISDDIRAVVHLLQEKREVDILASPRVMVVSGQMAEIQTIEQIPYQQLTQSSAGGGGASAITSTEFKDVGVKMEVKATVTDDGKILLVIKPEQSVSTGTSIGGVPVIDKRGVSTTLLMDDGQVAAMGGLRRQETTRRKDQIPILGDLPLIGFIFSDERTVIENSELMVLLSPHLFKGEQVPADAMARFNHIRNKSLIAPPDESKEKSQKKQKK